MNRYLNRFPTITIREGHRVKVYLTNDLEFHLAFDARQLPEIRREHNSDHRSVWTSTDSTGGRSRTMGAQLSPASADAYTCPPVVPK